MGGSQHIAASGAGALPEDETSRSHAGRFCYSWPLITPISEAQEQLSWLEASIKLSCSVIWARIPK